MGLSFDPDATNDHSLDVAILGNDDERAFDIQLRAANAGTVGYRVTGLALINSAGTTIESATGNVGAAIELVPVGSAWIFSKVVVA